MGAWSKAERFLRSQGFVEEEIERILAIARQEDLDPSLIDRVLAQRDETEGATTRH